MSETPNLREAIENAAKPVKLTGKSLDRIVAAVESFYQKDTQEYGNHDVNSIVTSFKESFGTTKITKYDRWAASRLAKKYGADYVVNIIRALAAKSGERYAPTVNSVSQLEEKLLSVMRFLAREYGAAREIEL